MITPKIVCLCGSTRFKEAFEKANREETMKGNIVLSVGCFGHADKIELAPEMKVQLDELHFKKIELASEILVLNVGGYIGESTRREINYATQLGRLIKYLEPAHADCNSDFTSAPNLPPEKTGTGVGGTPSLHTFGKDFVADLENLHAKFGDIQKLVAELPGAHKRALLNFRREFLYEELTEFSNAKSPAEAVDGLIDLIVVAIGTLHMFGIDTHKAWNVVHKANMAKECGRNPSRPNPLGLPDLLKPEGWSAPSHDDNVGMFDGVIPFLR